MKRRIVFFLLLCLYLTFSPVYAYIDPSAGSLWIQSVIAIFATAGTVFSVYWQKIKEKCFKNKNKNKNKNVDKPDEVNKN